MKGFAPHSTPTPPRPFERLVWREGALAAAPRVIVEEAPIALVYNASTYAVMMATPNDLEDFGIGFSLAEGIVERASDVRELQTEKNALGVEVRMWIDPAMAERLAEQRRRLAGPTGCGLCGAESLEAVRRPPRPAAASDARIGPAGVLRAMESLSQRQALNQATRAAHAAGFARADGEVTLAREDVGRHNALDKLIGAMARAGSSAEAGAIVLSSRVSIEMVLKAAVAGAPFIIAASAPTSLAVETAEAAGITLIAIARSDGFEVFTHPERLALS
jgi:FdhD protein